MFPMDGGTDLEIIQSESSRNMIKLDGEMYLEEDLRGCLLLPHQHLPFIYNPPMPEGPFTLHSATLRSGLH